MTSNTALFKKVYDFLHNSPLEHITAVSVVHQIIEDNPWFPKEDLRTLIHRAITSVNNLYEQQSEKYQKLIGIPLKFDDAFEGLCSLRDIEVARHVEPLTTDEIGTNLRTLKANLKKSKASYAHLLLSYIKKTKSSELSWRDPLASQVLSSHSELIRKLPEAEYNSFMEPAKRMEVPTPPLVKVACDNFVTNYNNDAIEESSRKLFHENWTESEEALGSITTGVLDVLGEIWKNPAFGPKFAKSQSEGTYVTDIIVPVIRAVLKKLPVGKSAFISTAERQSVASKDRRGKRGKRPDIMFIAKHDTRIYELIFAECSRLVCDKQKEDDDEVKLWREINDGSYWAHRGCKIDGDEFGVIGIQVAGQKLHLYVLIRDDDEINRLFLLRSVDIPTQYSDADCVFRFVETLLFLRRILIVDLSQLFNSEPRLYGHSENSSTVSSP